MAQQPTAHSADRTSPLLAFLLVLFGLSLLVLSLLLHLRLRAMAYDDAYIHLRIVRNLLQHGYAWFNPGERVMATSSPLWTALLAVLQAPSWPQLLPTFEAVLLWAAVVLAGLAAYRNLQRDAAEPGQRGLRLAAAAVASGTAVFLLLLSSSVGQMETPLAVALLLLAWATALRNSALALPALACAAIARLEWLPLFFVAAILWWFWTRRWQPIATACGIVALAAGCTVQQFGVLLPNSMRAKQIGYSISVGRAFREWVNPRLRDELLLAVLLLLLLWCAVDAARAWRRGSLTPSQAVPLFAAWGALVVAAEYIARTAHRHLSVVSAIGPGASATRPAAVQACIDYGIHACRAVGITSGSIRRPAFPMGGPSSPDSARGGKPYRRSGIPHRRRRCRPRANLSSGWGSTEAAMRVGACHGTGNRCAWMGLWRPHG